MSSLFDRVGGDAAVNAAVDLFYNKVLADDRIKHFFDSVDMDGQSKKQKAFFTTIFRGETAGAAEYMRRSHADLVENHGLNEGHFGAVSENLQATLEELGLGDDLVGEIMTAAAGLQDAVLNR